MTFAAVGSSGACNNASSLSLTTNAIGDFILLGWTGAGGTGQLTGATSSNAVWSVLVPPNMTASGAYSGVLIGYVTAVSTATVTFITTGTLTGITAQTKEFSTSVGLQSLRVDTKGVYQTGSGNLNFPSLNPSHGSGELYFCFAQNTGSYTAGGTSGFHYNVDTSGNMAVWNTSCTNAQQAPTAATSTGVGSGIGILLWEQNGQQVMDGFVPDQIATPSAINGTTGTIVITWPVAPTPGSKVLIQVSESGASNYISATDNGTTPTNFTADNFGFNGSNHAWQFRGDNITLPLKGPYQVTIVFSATCFASAFGASWLGLAAGGPVSGSGGVFNDGASSTASSNSVTPTQAGCLLLATLQTNSGNNPEKIFQTDTGWVSLGQQNNGSSFECGMASYATSVSSAAVTAHWTVSDTPTWMGILSAYAPATSTIQPNVGLVSEMQLGGTWQDVSTWVHQRDAVTISRGRQNESAGMQAANQTETIKNQDGRFTLRNPSSPYYPNLLQNSPIRASIPSYYGGIPSYLRMQTDDNSGIQIPDVSPIAIANYTPGTVFASAVTTANQTIPATAQGSTLIAIVAYGNTGWTQSITSVTVSGGASTATFNKVSANQSFDSYISIWELPNCPYNTTTVTANFNAACHGIIRVYEVRGLDPAGSLDVFSSAGNTGSPASSGAAGPSHQANCIVIGAISAQSTAITGTGVGFTNNAASANWFVGDGNGDLAIDGYQIVSAENSFTYSATFSGGSGGWTACCAVFRQNANGVGNSLSEFADAQTGIYSVRVDCKITDWQHNHVLASKYGSIGKSWALWTNGTGILTFDIYDGTTDHFVFSSCPVPYFSGRIAIRVDYDVALQTVTFYTAPNMGGPWTQLGITQNTSISSSTHARNQPVQIGFGSTTLPGMYGEIYEASFVSGGKTYDFENAAEANDFSTNGGTLSVSTAQHNTGDHSLLLTANGTANTYVTTDFYCGPGATAGGNLFVFTSRAQNLYMAIDWFDASGNYISTAGFPSVAVPATTWTQLTLPGSTAPALAVHGHMYLGAGSPTNTDLIYIDTFTNFGSTVFDAIVPFGLQNWTDQMGNVWAVEGTAELTNKLYRFHGEWAQSPKSTDETTNDVFIQATSYGINQRLSNANTPLASPMRRAYKFLPTAYRLADYWPMEEGSKANSFGSAVGGSPMTFAGTPTLSSYSGFVSSAPIPVINNAVFIAPVRTSSVIWQDNVTRFLLAVPSSDDTNGAVVARVFTNGTVARMDLVYGTGGTLNLQLYNSSNGLIVQTGNLGFGLAELANCRVSMELVYNNGSPNYGLWVLTANGSVANGSSGSVPGGATVGGVTQVAIDPTANLVGSAVGHLSVQAVDDGINDLINPLIAWTGEAAATRFARICTEEGLNVRIMGPTESSQVMGFQPIDTLSNILQQCEATDQGQQYEPRDSLALGYRTIRGLYNQQIMSSPSFLAADLFTGFGSTADTQLTVNDVTASAADGSTARQTMSSGFPNNSKMNTNPPNYGWSPASGSLTSAPAFDNICLTGPVAPGTYTIKWSVALAGTLSAGDANNFIISLYNPNTNSFISLATSVNGSTAGLYSQADVVSFVIPSGGWEIGIYIRGTTPTTGSVYSGYIFEQDAGIGSVQTSTSPNPASDTELNSSANWTLHVRSIDDDRYPLLPFHIARPETPKSIFLLDIGDYLQIPDGPIWLPNGPIKQLAAGFQETYYPGAHGIVEINGIPELPYEVAVAASGAQRLASAGSFLSAAYTYGNTSITVAPYSGSLTQWTTNASDFPFNIVMAGMILQVTNITGGFGVQTFTVGATSLNGVVKNLVVGTPVQVASPMVVAW